MWMEIFAHIFLCRGADHHSAILWIWKPLQFNKLSAHELSAACDEIYNEPEWIPNTNQAHFSPPPYWKETRKKMYAEK